MDRTPTLRQLRYFVTLAETGHFRRAAERVGVTQPSLSLQIENLERVLGIALIERGRAGAVLTPAGREVLARAGRILADVQALVDAAATLGTGMVGSIRLGASPTVGPYLLPDVARRLHELYPALRLFIRDGAPRDLLADLLAGRHDLILTQLPVASAEVETVRLYSEPLHLAVARDHRLAGRARVADADLAGETILALSSAFSLHDQIAALAREVGASLRQDYEGTSLDALRQMTAMNMGVTFLPALYVRSEAARPDGDVVVLPFRKGGFLRAIGLAWRRTAGDQAAYRALVEVIRGVVARTSGPLVRLDP